MVSIISKHIDGPSTKINESANVKYDSNKKKNSKKQVGKNKNLKKDQNSKLGSSDNSNYTSNTHQDTQNIYQLTKLGPDGTYVPVSCEEWS